LPYFPDIGAGLKYEMAGVEHVYIVPVLMHITTSDDFWQTGSCRCYMPLAEGGALSAAVLTISYVRDSYRDIDSYVTILPSLPT